MKIHNHNHEERKHELEPIRGSIIILVAKLATVLLLFDLLYVGLYYLLTLSFALPFDLHHHISLLLLVIFFLKLLMQLFLILNVTLSWANSAYYLAGKHIIRRNGILHVEEDVFHFDNIRSISVNQSFFGKIFNYGDISLKTSASGVYEGDVIMTEISNPKKYEEILREYF